MTNKPIVNIVVACFVLAHIPALSQSPSGSQRTVVPVQSQSTVAELNPLANALNLAVDFISKLRTRVKIDFTTPAMRDDATKELNGTYDDLGILINENRNLVEAITKDDDPGVKSSVAKLEATITSIRDRFERVIKLLPDVDKESAVRAINGLSKLLDQKAGSLRAIYRHSDDVVKIPGLAQNASLLAYQVREGVSALISDLAKEDQGKQK